MFLTGGCGKDNRTILYSESSYSLVVKNNYNIFDQEIEEIDKSKLAAVIANHVSSVLEVYDISDAVEKHWKRDKWHIFFTVKTDQNQVFRGVKCLAAVGVWDGLPEGPVLRLLNCGSMYVRIFDGDIRIPLSQIVI